MLPLIDKPAIHYVVEEAISSGIDDILIITGRGKRAIEDYFDHSPELEFHLEKKGRMSQLAALKKISSIENIHFIRQKEPRGLGDAIGIAEKHIGDEPFAVLLGDDILRGAQPCTKQLIDISTRKARSVIAVQPVPREKISSYGIIKGKYTEAGLLLLEDIVEKPGPENAPSDLGAIGRYVFTPDIFDCLRKTPAGVGNELHSPTRYGFSAGKRKCLPPCIPANATIPGINSGTWRPSLTSPSQTRRWGNSSGIF